MRYAIRTQPAKGVTAFSLIELLVVVSIIAILSAMMLSGITVVKDAASQQACSSNMRQVAYGIGAYQADNSSLYPPFAIGTIVQDWWSPGPGGRWYHFIEEYTETFAVFNCPTVKRFNPRFAVRDVTDATGIRGDAPNGRVCAMSADTRLWIRYPQNGWHAWTPSAPYGPMSDTSARAHLSRLSTTNAAYMAPNPAAKIELCPVISDGVWQNDGANQSGNGWGAYFPHRKRGNFIFNDGHVESHTAADFRTFTPVVQLRR